MNKREIKFRGWDSELKFMVDPSKYLVGFDGKLYFNNNGQLIEQTDKLNLIAFTGLHDKNGKEVFECDIITASKFEGGRIVDFTLGSFGVADWHLWEIEGSIEIIGNLYENPELLK